MLKKGPGGRLLVLGVLAAVTAVAVPLALGGGGPELFNACYQKSDGTLRIDVGTGCRRTEVGIQLSGPVELPPPRRAFSHEVNDVIALPETPGSVNHLEIADAGRYIITGVATLQNDSFDIRALVNCSIPNTGGGGAKIWVGANTPQVPSLVAVPYLAEFTGPGAIDLSCDDGYAGDASIVGSRLTAIPVDDIVSNAFDSG